AAVEAARDGGMLMPSPVARLVLALFAPEPASPDYRLSPRAREVLAATADGPSQTDMANRLGLTPNTVHPHGQHLYTSLHVRSASAAVAKALRERLVEMGTSRRYGMRGSARSSHLSSRYR